MSAMGDVVTRCKNCSYAARTAIWCSDPACCDQTVRRFLAALPRRRQEGESAIYAVRFASGHAGDEYSLSIPVLVWHPAVTQPIFSGTLGEAVQFAMDHECEAA